MALQILVKTVAIVDPTRPMCEEYTPNPVTPDSHYLIKCYRRARRVLTIQTPADVQTVNCCYTHALQFQAEAKAGKVEILTDEAIEAPEQDKEVINV